MTAIKAMYIPAGCSLRCVNTLPEVMRSSKLRFMGRVERMRSMPTGTGVFLLGLLGTHRFCLPVFDDIITQWVFVAFSVKLIMYTNF